MVGPGAPEIVLGLATVAHVDGAAVFICSAIFQGVATFHRAFDTDAFTLSTTGGGALVIPAIFNVVALDSEEPIEDLLFPSLVPRLIFPATLRSTLNGRVVPSTDGSKVIRITAGGVVVAIPSGQSHRVYVLAPGSIVSVDPPTDLAYWSEVSVVVDEGACLDMAGHETGLRFGPLPTKMCVLVKTDSALHNVDADPDQDGSDDASVPEERRTALTVGSEREGCSVGVGRDQKRSGLMLVPTRVQLGDGLSKPSAGVFLRNALTWGAAQLHEKSTKVLRRKQLSSCSKEVQDVSVVQMDLEQKDRWQ